MSIPVIPPSINTNCQAVDAADGDIAASFVSLSTGIRVATLVFFDVETTGLAKDVGKKNVQITEISMIAVDRDEFFKSVYPDLRDVRVIQKLSLCVKPKCALSDVVTKLTGLSNERLQLQEAFDENTAVAIIAFLSHLLKPLALLAHNGKCFDFPVLKAELEKLNARLPLDTYIVDTLSGFRNIGIPDLPFNQKLHKDVRFKKSGGVSMSLENLHLYFFGRHPVGCHSSEGDCITLAKVCHKMREELLPWIDKNCADFDSVVPMW